MHRSNIVDIMWSRLLTFVVRLFRESRANCRSLGCQAREVVGIGVCRVSEGVIFARYSPNVHHVRVGICLMQVKREMERSIEFD